MSTQVLSRGKAIGRAFVNALGLASGLLVWTKLLMEYALENLTDVVHGGPERIRTRLSALMAMAVEDENGVPLRVDRRIVLATWPAKDSDKVKVACLGKTIVLSKDEVKALKVPMDHPYLLTDEEEAEFRVLMWACEWAEKEGYLRKGWSMDPDSHIELGYLAKPARKGREVRKLSDFVQYRDRDTDEGKALIRRHWQERERTDRFVETPMFSVEVTERNLIVGHTLAYEKGEDGKDRPIRVPVYEKDHVLEPGEFLYHELRTTGRDPSDVDSEEGLGSFRNHEGYNDVSPLHRPSKEENALLKRLRYRIDDASFQLYHWSEAKGAYLALKRLKPYVFDAHGAVAKEFLDSKGNIKPEALDPWLLRSSFRPNGGKKVKFWDKRFLPRGTVQIVEPVTITDVKEIVRIWDNPYPYVGVYEKDHVTMALKVLVSDPDEVEKILRDPDRRNLAAFYVEGRGVIKAKLEWYDGELKLHRKPDGKPHAWRMSPPASMATYAAETIGMLRGVIESGHYTDIALCKTDDYEQFEEGFKEVNGQRTWYRHSVSKLKKICRRCEDRGETEPRVWVKKSHAWVCSVCGSERARVYGRVWVDVDYLGGLPIKERLEGVTHVAFNVYGRWIGELVDSGAILVDGVPTPPPSLRRFWTPSSKHGPLHGEEVREQPVYPRWVDELLEAESEVTAKFWAAFKSSVLKRRVSDVKRKKAADKAVEERVAKLAKAQREFFRNPKVYGCDCIDISAK